MRGRWIFVLGALVVALIIAAPTAVGPLIRHLTQSHVNKLPDPAYQRGLNVMLYRTTNSIGFESAMREWESWNITDISLVIPLTQPSPWSDAIGAGAITPTDAQIRQAVTALQGAGFRVLLRPILDERTLTPLGYWRGDIQPSSVDGWFSHYQAAIVHYAEVAQALHIASLDIGTELVSVQGDTPQWQALIERVRAVYRGRLLYSVNWTDLTVEPWFSSLNQIGLDAYFPLSVPGSPPVPSVSALEGGWQTWLSKIPAFPKPLVITELGLLPVAGSYKTPYLWTLPHAVYSPTTQANYYAAGCSTWTPRVAGLYWWGVSWGSNTDGPTSFTPTPPAIQALQACFQNSPKAAN
jgi:hypothetical protein